MITLDSIQETPGNARLSQFVPHFTVTTKVALTITSDVPEFYERSDIDSAVRCFMLELNASVKRTGSHVKLNSLHISHNKKGVTI